MTPSSPDRSVLQQRLRALQDALATLATIGDVDAARLDAEPITRAAAERLLQAIVDLAIDINAHIAVSLHGSAPPTGRESFLAIAPPVLDRVLAERLALAAGLRSVLVHRYTDIRTDLVACAVADALTQFPDYVRQVAAYTTKLP
jgi:uncharacterized protein YutE (UPF0331/DUF86 family)